MQIFSVGQVQINIRYKGNIPVVLRNTIKINLLYSVAQVKSNIQ
jgi:hypothetical protein